MTNSIVVAEDIAKQQLRACYGDFGILAGAHHFTDYWARDGFFASMGSVEIGDFEIVVKMIELFFGYQRADGMVPYRVMNGPVTIGKYFGKVKKYVVPSPTYKLRGFGTEVLDGTTLAVMTLMRLCNEGKVDRNKYSAKIAKAVEYLKSKEKNGLLWDGEMSEWNDVVKKKGNLLYSNVLYWNMYRELGDIHKQNIIAKKLRERLWSGKYYADWDDGEKHNYFYSFGNLLAVAWGLTNKDESALILSESKKNRILFTIDTNNPKYPEGKVWWINRIAGVADYQNQGLLWWQPACAYVAALVKVGEIEKAGVQLKLMSDKIVKDKKIWECYERTGNPVERLLYRSEQPFAWGAGMFLWAKQMTMGVSI